MDPGAMALIGPASFFAGVSQTVSYSYHDRDNKRRSVPSAADVGRHDGEVDRRLHHTSSLSLAARALLHSIPRLGTYSLYDEHHVLLNLELFKARDVMHRPVITITPRESMSHLARLLLETSHGGFPVVTYYEKTRHEVAYGLMTRMELCIILCHDRTRSMQFVGATISPEISYEELSVER